MKTQTTKTENLHVFAPVFVHGFQPRYEVVALFDWTRDEKLTFAAEQLRNVNHFSTAEH